MKKNDSHNSEDKISNVKEISDGVYINLNRITTDKENFEKAVEESFKELANDEIIKNAKAKSENTED